MILKFLMINNFVNYVLHCVGTPLLSAIRNINIRKAYLILILGNFHSWRLSLRSTEIFTSVPYLYVLRWALTLVMKFQPQFDYVTRFASSSLKEFRGISALDLWCSASLIPLRSSICQSLLCCSKLRPPGDHASRLEVLTLWRLPLGGSRFAEWGAQAGWRRLWEAARHAGLWEEGRGRR